MREILGLIVNTGWVAKSVLIILGILSIITWAIIFEKITIFNKIRRQSVRYQGILKNYSKGGDLYKASRDFPYCPSAKFFLKAYQEYHMIRQRRQMVDSEKEDGNGQRITLDVSSILRSTVSEELAGPSKSMTLLSTIVGISPFLGLFGTVWGVMEAFIHIGIQGSADISVVSPGIAEALITTVVGLAIAIPALAAYNLSVAELRKIEDQLDVFSDEFKKWLERGKLT